MAETVLERSELGILLRTTWTLMVWSIVAFVVWLCCMKIQGILLAKIPYVGEKDYAVFRTMWCILIYSIAVIEFNARFAVKAG